MRKTLSIVLVLLLLLIGSNHATFAALTAADVPTELSRWQAWVLHGQEQALCPCHYNNGAVVLCRWPSHLQLELSADGGKFEQRWMIYAQGWADLPGGPEIWPESVAVDGQPAAVIARGQIPAVHLTPGEHRIVGRFTWHRMPEMMPVPPALGLLSLVLDGRTIRTPMIDDQGRVWLRQGAAADSRPDEVKVQVFRLLDDLVPMQVTTLLKLDISGQTREIDLADVLIQGSTPMAIDSPLPARINADGRLTVQARPGRWEVRMLARLAGPQHKISAGACPHGEEIWSFQPQHALRMVEVEDVLPVEPSQTEMPEQWRALQAYLIKPQSSMTLKEIRRGDPDPAPDQLTLQRTWWLDFDGGGFTVHDEISGTLSRQWQLAMNPPLALGRVTAAGQERVITELGALKKLGVELRQGSLELQADGRLSQRTGAVSAVGWDHDFQSVAGVLHLPPGWRLLAATGVDSISDAWLQRWTLLDFFLVLIIALAVFKLRAWLWAVIALAAMALILHEPGAPRLVWLHLLAVLAVLPHLSEGWFKRLVALWGIGAMVVLLVTVVPFVVKQIRWGIYPQLAPQYDFAPSPQVAGYDAAQEDTESLSEQAASSPSPVLTKTARRGKFLSSSQPMDGGAQEFKAAEVLLHQQDPDALIPTGPGLPDWRWQSIDLRWSGPVAKEQTMRLYLLSPLVNLLLALARVGLLILLIWGLIGAGSWYSAWWRPWWQRTHQRISVAAAMMLLAASLATLQAAPVAGESAEFPPPALLDELRQRLLEKPDCLPQCVDVSRLEVVADGDRLQVMLKLNSAERMAVPLPVHRKSWTPDQIMLDNAPMAGLARDEAGQLWGLVPAGLHTLMLSGNVSQEALIQIPLPLAPHAATYSVQGWNLEGIQADGRVGATIQLMRLQAEPSRSSGTRANGLPPFLKVERTLHLGLTWQTTTTITRLTPVGTPIVANIPLLADESVTTAGIQVEQGQALIHLAPDQRVAVYHAGLKISPLIQLEAPKAVAWTETWILDAGAVWHCDLEGIAVIHLQDRTGQWQPQWQPWPGEKVVIHVQRPPATAGQTKTIDKAELVLTPGARFGQGELNLSIRTSRGGQHTVELPAKANLQQVTVDGQTLPVRQDGAYVTVPLPPGGHQIGLQWHQLAPFTTLFKVPAMKIGQAAVNAQVSIHMPAQRWILLAGGPRWGPAVLFWSYFAAIVLAALVMGRISPAPLKSRQWLLLGLGLTQISPAMALLIAGWLLALALRERHLMPRHWLAFDAVQIGLAVWTLAALLALFAAVKAGLLGAPEMQIAGNHSTHEVLHWTQDHIADILPQPWVLSLPVWVYRVLMLAWSLWLALTLLGWLKWGRHCFSKDGLWRKVVLRRKKQTPAPASGAGG